jgi:peroxiredoxin
MFPHERSLVSKMKNRPFALLGVNTDSSADEVKQKNKQANISWRSWFDGRGGPICGKYQIQGFPTLMLVDAKGIIRKKWVGGPKEGELDSLIEKLVKEAEKGSGSGGTASADDKKPGDDKPAASGGGSSAPVGFDIGNRAPEISGKDTNGKTFKLSEYKGKVVVLDFWGFW